MSQIESRLARVEDKVGVEQAENPMIAIWWADPMKRDQLLRFMVLKEARAGGRVVRDILLRGKKRLDQEQARATDPLADLLHTSTRR
jgi:hypothetical protein